ncbi:hypothetical protein Cgig2_017050 [Carnegiea gigantea]|uniref:Uncharacterized protein n=1 Tax=Carnegiea gigantea TaxID=171969 RepID=A0A9Q1Q8H0_9CARY|nr:hypothetical protein Cgig2_017050 [Carnegiea gigantea]
MMLVSDTMHACSKGDKALVTDAPVAPEVEDAPESLRANPCSVIQRPPEQKADVTVDALKNFITTMTDTILQQVTEQVKKTMEIVSSMKPALPSTTYLPQDVSRPTDTFPSNHCIEVAESSEHDRLTRLPKGDSLTPRSCPPHTHPLPLDGLETNFMIAASKPHNAWKNCEFYEQNGRTTAECWQLKKALHELDKKGQIDRFLKRVPRSLRNGCDSVCEEP